jgi:hypothetical protein
MVATVALVSNRSNMRLPPKSIGVMLARQATDSRSGEQRRRQANTSGCAGDDCGNLA